MPTAKRKHYRHLPAFILLALTEKPAHGGAIKSLLEGWLPGFTADSAALYRALQTLEKEGAVTSAWDTTPPGPARRVYQVTPRGWQELGQWRDDIEKRLKLLRSFLDHYDRLREKAPLPEPAPTMEDNAR
ncbi:MAG: helix-turn-helix transcriptional regulator [Deltaproteobacteria bacterium]|nr:helix-turn-helix transcriptional regulator [Deltaproteobacteria bacterium]